MVGATRGLQLLRHESERPAAWARRQQVLGTIGALARGRGAERYLDPRNFTGLPHEIDDAPLLGTPAEIVERLKRLEAGGVEYVLLVDPSPSPETLQVFAREVMPAFVPTPVAAS